jgi:hypothetical protein
MEGTNFNVEQAKEFITGRLLDQGVTQEQVQDLANQMAGIETREDLEMALKGFKMAWDNQHGKEPDMGMLLQNMMEAVSERWPNAEDATVPEVVEFVVNGLREV